METCFSENKRILKVLKATGNLEMYSLQKHPLNMKVIKNIFKQTKTIHYQANYANRRKIIPEKNRNARTNEKGKYK